MIHLPPVRKIIKVQDLRKRLDFLQGGVAMLCFFSFSSRKGGGGSLGGWGMPLLSSQVTDGVYSFLGSSNAVPQSWSLQARDYFFCLTALESQSLKSRGRLPLKALREDLFLSPPASLVLLVSWLRHTSFCLCHPMAIFSLGVHLFSFHKDTSGFRALSESVGPHGNFIMIHRDAISR